MVPRETQQRTPIVWILLLLLVGVVVFVVWGVVAPKKAEMVEQGAVSFPEKQGPEVVEEEPLLVPPEKVDFQPVVETWAASVGGNRSVLVYDLDRGEMAASYNPAEDYGTASLYKLFVVYEGYRRVESGEWDGEARAGSTGYTINKCLDLAIRESYSPCAETLWAMLGHDALDTIIENDYGIVGSDISRLVSNAADILKIMQRFYEHPDFHIEALLSRMWDSFLNQPKTTYDWRQGLPSGFLRAEVYNKVGWAYNPAGQYWDIYHDAAIVKFPVARVYNIIYGGISSDG